MRMSCTAKKSSNVQKKVEPRALVEHGQHGDDEFQNAEK